MGGLLGESGCFGSYNTFRGFPKCFKGVPISFKGFQRSFMRFMKVMKKFQGVPSSKKLKRVPSKFWGGFVVQSVECINANVCS